MNKIKNKLKIIHTILLFELLFSINRDSQKDLEHSENIDKPDLYSYYMAIKIGFKLWLYDILDKFSK